MRGPKGVAVGLAVALGGCATGFVPRDPAPVLPPALAAAVVQLEIGPRVGDAFYAECPDALYLSGEDTATIRVAQWRQALVKGFESAFPKVAAADPSAPRFEIQKAELAFQEVERNAYGRVVSVQAAVRYQVQLVDGSGAVVRSAEGTALSKGPSGVLAEVPDLIGSAVEAMYEAAARALLAPQGEGR